MNKLLILLTVGLLASSAGAQTPKASSALYVRNDGTDVRAAIEIRITRGWHLYHDDLGGNSDVGIPTTVELSGADIAWSKVRFPKPLKLDQKGVGPGGSDLWIYGHEGKIVLFARGKASSSTPDLAAVGAKIDGLTCEDSGSCIPYGEELKNLGRGSDELFKTFPADLAVGEPGATVGAPTKPSDGNGASTPVGGATDWNAVDFPDYTPRSQEGDRSLLAWLFFAFIAGVLLNVMPCVLPVVSIKVLSFVQQAGEEKSRILALGLAFSAGIIAVFLGLAAMAVFAHKGWGEQFQNETFKITLVGVVFGFALSLFDVFELGVPSQVGLLASVKREGLPDAFFKGIMATVLATPCSGPFLGSTLAWAVGQKSLTVFAIFLVAGIGMAAPYALLTSNPALLKYVPKPGAWMKTFKHLMGFLLLATVIFLMISLRQDRILYTVTFLIFVGLGCWWWGHFATFDQSRPKHLATLGVALLIVALGARVSFVDLPGLLQGDESEAASSGAVPWEDFDPKKLADYHQRGVPVMLDFTANWCLTCKTNEKYVYASERVEKLLHEKGVVAMKADMTHDSPQTEAIKRLRSKLGANSIPFMVIFPGKDWQKPFTFKDLVTRGEVEDALASLP